MSSAPARPGAPGTPRPAPAAVAFCPCPPLLLPAVAGRAAGDTAGLRAACATAVDALLAARPEVVVVVGAGGGAGVRYGQGDGGDLRGFGVDLGVPFAGRVRPGRWRTPLAHTVGAWLLDEAGHAGLRLGVGPGDLAGALADLPARVAVLAMGDGSARRSVKAPGHLDDAAEPFDDAVAAALAGGDADALAALDATEGARLLAAGVPTWRAVGAVLAGRAVTGRLHAHEAPFGVGYLVADWRVR
ncbi:hypothetical protein SAMN06893096_110118 [Geodermatophilus pulveris]|uniref:Catalytic LigB subunit of aromatic ring-opening dioxygenase n=1 Tax=Geodermatophilus pulveris TaxID=1564159 RepID=A0A239IDC8_9ACTN|nr:hypothetical protein [Geodermatophilus pulveris]SNS91650.1 hypothetical protein SAMN06893096_110118 [Geodermatophilus pulveris]